MRAIVITRYGPPEVLTIQEVPDPAPGADDVLIRVRAFGLNHAEAYMRPTGVQLSFFASAFVYGSPEYPLTDIPFADFVTKAEKGELHARPARTFAFDEIVAAHRLMETGAAGGKMVVSV